MDTLRPGNFFCECICLLQHIVFTLSLKAVTLEMIATVVAIINCMHTAVMHYVAALSNRLNTLCSGKHAVKMLSTEGECIFASC